MLLYPATVRAVDLELVVERLHGRVLPLPEDQVKGICAFLCCQIHRCGFGVPKLQELEEEIVRRLSQIVLESQS